MSSASSFVTGSGLQDVNRANVLDFGQAYKSSVNITLTDQGALAMGGELAHMGILSANSAIDSMSDVVGELVGFAGQETERNRALIGQAGKAVLDFARAESDDNRAFAGQAVVEIRAANERATAAQQAAAERAAAVTLDAMQNMRAAQDQAFQFVGGAFTESVSAISTQASDTLNGITTFVADVVKNVNKTTTDSIAAVGEATRSDASKSLDKVIMLAGVVMVAMAFMTGGGLKRAF